ncbi:GTPase [Brachyspira aalborgi]|uniref:GTPase n=1 Tax=Brachyspira aalborgi TaxID=29522 RepID=UPI00266D8FA9|nr:GTPase domain-containing protein [Brachyspira aalborgi]
MSNNDELTLNLLILGQTGVGKSSLINALFGEIVAKAGPGKPISTHIKKYETELDGKKVNLYDSMGFEVNNEKCIKDIKDALKERSADKDIKDWFHSVTYCIQAGGLKIQDFDIKMIKQFVDENYNVIIALTKSDQIGKAKREEFIDIIKKEVKENTKKDIMVITLSADPEQLDHMTEKPKPSGLEEYKAAILISWREIFINRIPVHIVKKLKEDIENAKSNAPKEGKDKELTNKIQEYFSNILNTNIQKHVRENIEKYYKITADILNTSKDIKLSKKELNSDFYSGFNFVEDVILSTIEEFRYGDSSDIICGIIALVISAPITIPFAILEHVVVKPIEYLYHLIQGRKEDIEYFIYSVSDEYIKKISTEEFEREIRKIIINDLKEIDKKIIKLN